MTYLQIVNAVLRRLREDTVSNWNESDYSTLIGDLVNEVKREVEESWDWGVLRTTASITTSSGISNYSIIGLNEGFEVLHVINDTDDHYLQKVTFSHMNDLFRLSTTQNGSPYYWAMNAKDGSNLFTLDVYPVPDGAYDLRFYVTNPQDDLDNDATNILVPHLPVVLGAYARALEERGEDQGTAVNSAYAKYKEALANAVAKSVALYDDEVVWKVV